MGVDYDTQTFKKWVEGILTGPKVTGFCLDEGLSHNTMTRVVLFKQRMWPAIYLLFQGPPHGSSSKTGPQSRIILRIPMCNKMLEDIIFNRQAPWRLEMHCTQSRKGRKTCIAA